MVLPREPLSASLAEAPAIVRAVRGPRIPIRGGGSCDGCERDER